MMRADDSRAQLTQEDWNKQRGLLRFAISDGRLAGLPVLLLVYPCLTFARDCDPRELAREDRLTATLVNQAWKKQMLVANAYPDLGGNPEEAILLNNAKIEIMSFLESCKPKLGAHFKKE